MSPPVYDTEKAQLANSTPNAAAHNPPHAMAPTQFRVLGNPGPLGLFGFASTTFLLSMYNVQTRGVTHPNVVLGMGLFVGGLAQFLAGMWEFATANTFGATAFTMYGGFWMSFATIFIPGAGITAAYTDTSELDSALGIYLFTWFIITFLLLLGAIRLSVSFILLFFFLDITFILLGSSYFASSATTSVHLAKAGGGFGLVTALVAFYLGTSILLETLSPGYQFYVKLPRGDFSRRTRVD